MDPAVVTAFFLSIVDKWIAEGATQEEVARRIGTSGPFVSQLRNGKRQLGDTVAAKVAAAIGVSFGEFLVQAEKFAAAHPDRVRRRETAVVYDERYPNRRKAIEFVQSSTRPVSKAAVDSVLSMSLQSADDPNTEWWLDELRAEDRRLSKLAGEPVIVPPVPSRPPLAERIADEKKKRGK